MGYNFSSSYCFVWIMYLLIKYCIFFPFSSSHLANVSVLLCLVVTPVRISSVMECLSPKLHWLPHSTHTHTHTPPPTTCIIASGWHYANVTFHCPHSSLYKPCIGILLDSRPLRTGLIGCPETLVRNYHYLLCNNLEQHSSQPQSMFLPPCDRPSFTPIQNKSQNYSSGYLNLCTFGEQTGTLKILHWMTASIPWLQSALNFIMNGILIWHGCFQISGLSHPFRGFIIYLNVVILSCILVLGHDHILFWHLLLD